MDNEGENHSALPEDRNCYKPKRSDSGVPLRPKPPPVPKPRPRSETAPIATGQQTSTPSVLKIETEKAGVKEQLKHQYNNIAKAQQVNFIDFEDFQNVQKREVKGQVIIKQGIARTPYVPQLKLTAQSVADHAIPSKQTAPGPAFRDKLKLWEDLGKSQRHTTKVRMDQLSVPSLQGSRERSHSAENLREGFSQEMDTGTNFSRTLKNNPLGVSSEELSKLESHESHLEGDWVDQRSERVSKGQLMQQLILTSGDTMNEEDLATKSKQLPSAYGRSGVGEDHSSPQQELDDGPIEKPPELPPKPKKRSGTTPQSSTSQQSSTPSVPKTEMREDEPPTAKASSQIQGQLDETGVKGQLKALKATKHVASGQPASTHGEDHSFPQQDRDHNPKPSEIPPKHTSQPGTRIPQQQSTQASSQNTVQLKESGMKRHLKGVITMASNQLDLLPGVRQLKKMTKLQSETEIAAAAPCKHTTLGEFPFSDELPQDLDAKNFVSTCKKIHGRLLLICQYYKGAIICEAELMATYDQLENKEVSISVFGRHNCGKSTLLNVFAGGRYLPTKLKNETSFKVKIFHARKVHQKLCQMECQKEAHAEHTCTKQCCLLSKDREDVQCPKLCGVRNRAIVNTIYGEQQIYSFLETLNIDVREKKQAADDLPEFELKVCVPVLHSAPEGWRVCLVDNPGFGEASEHVTQLAEKGMKISSAYIYLLTTDSIRDTVDAEAFQNLAERDRVSFTDGRFVVAVTKFDMTYTSMDDEPVEESEAKDLVSDSIEEATSHAAEDAQPILIDQNFIIPVCGLWAYTAKFLKTRNRNDPRYTKNYKFALKALKDFPHLECSRGQGESLEDYFKTYPEKFHEKLWNASGMESLEKQIERMTISCVKVWAKKISADYGTFIRNAKERLQLKHTDVEEENDVNLAKHKAELDLCKSIDSGLEALKPPDNPKTSEVWKAIDAVYPDDIKSSDLETIGRQKIKTLVEELREDTKEKIRKKGLTQDTFEDSLTAFLKNASEKLDKTFNSTCAFSGAHDVLRTHSMEMMEKVAVVRHHTYELFKRSSLTMGDTKGVNADKKERSTSQVFEAPNLGEVKKKVCMPTVSFSFLDRLKHSFQNWVLRHDQTAQEKLQVEIEEKKASLEYRSWTNKHNEMMGLLQKSLEEQCESYFDDIRPKAVEYFYKKYKEDTEEKLKEFNMNPFKGQLSRKKEELDKLDEMIQKQQRELIALEATIPHLAVLEYNLKKKSEEYIH